MAVRCTDLDRIIKQGYEMLTDSEFKELDMYVQEKLEQAKRQGWRR